MMISDRTGRPEGATGVRWSEDDWTECIAVFDKFPEGHEEPEAGEFVFDASLTGRPGDCSCGFHAEKRLMAERTRREEEAKRAPTYVPVRAAVRDGTIRFPTVHPSETVHIARRLFIFTTDGRTLCGKPVARAVREGRWTDVTCGECWRLAGLPGKPRGR